MFGSGLEPVPLEWQVLESPELLKRVRMRWLAGCRRVGPLWMRANVQAAEPFLFAELGQARGAEWAE